jgi:hypothetical protein
VYEIGYGRSVAENLHLVLSEPPDGVSDEEFNRWYDAHLEEILATPGFVAARRFRLEPVVENPGSPVRYRYLAIYEIDGDPNEALAALEQRGMGNKDTYTALKDVDQGELELPDWFERVGFASLNAYPVGGRVEAAS